LVPNAEISHLKAKGKNPQIDLFPEEHPHKSPARISHLLFGV
jgi:hypothetical protein